MKRRDFIKKTMKLLAIGGFFFSTEDILAKRKKKSRPRKKASSEVILTNESVFEKILKQAEQNNWKTKNIGEVVIEVAKCFLGRPYEGGTLEVNGENEEIVVNLIEFDCVTLMESSLAFARMLKKGLATMNDFAGELEFIRYRKGKLVDYTSRLHYTSDWITDNESKGVIADISKSLGGIPIQFNVFFMSENSELYPVLRKVPKMIAEIEVYEEHIRKRTYHYIPKEQFSSIENKVQTGDIVAIVTNKPGLDFSHVGLIVVENNNVKLLHASSSQKKVVLDSSLQNYLASNTTATGVCILRPLEV
ncbi:MAG: DUF1460 domain-containing protein [Ignavibacteria bacterium]|nr:DUF1460 domain-containing protein [Ignavibacteria bacterium]